MAERKVIPMLRTLAVGVCVLGVLGGAAPVIAIYSGGFGHIVETRSAVLAQEGDLLLEDFPLTMLVDSVVLSGIKLTRMEAMSTRLLTVADWVGATVVVYAHGERFQGLLLAAEAGLVLSTADGVVFFSTYDRIVTSPVVHSGGRDHLALGIRYRDAVPGLTEVGVSYLAEGLSWTATYAAALGEGMLGLQGMATFVNRTGIDFLGAQVSLVAGDVYRPIPKVSDGYGIRALASFAEFDLAAVAEYHRYAFPAAVDLTQGVALVPLVSGDLAYTRAYRFSGGPVEVRVRFTNDLAPLPAGEVRVYDEGLFVGAATIGHTPRGKEVDLAIGAAFDLTGERVQELRQRLADSLYRDTYRITLRSAKDVPAEIEVVESISGTWTITHTSLPYERLDAQRILYKVTVPAGGTAEVRYTVEWRY